LTVCIAAICEAGGRNTKIVLCADRLVSSVVQFTSGEPKIKQINEHCYAMHSSSDSLISEAILKRVAEKAKANGTTSTGDIVSILRQECLNYKSEEIERDILCHYNMTAKSLGVNQESMLQAAVNEVKNYQYHLTSEYIVAGLEPSGDAHIYWVNQDGDYRCHDSIGYCAIGSGGLIAFLDLTKVVYNCQAMYSAAIPLVYFAKKTSERATGVGIDTDILLIHYPKPEEKESKPALWNPLVDPKIRTLLDETCKKIRENELNQLNEVCQQLFELIKANVEAEKSKLITTVQKIGS
jgi:20S proteasome alpha/beta subunit